MMDDDQVDSTTTHVDDDDDDDSFNGGSSLEQIRTRLQRACDSHKRQQEQINHLQKELRKVLFRVEELEVKEKVHHDGMRIRRQDYAVVANSRDIDNTKKGQKGNNMLYNKGATLTNRPTPRMLLRDWILSLQNRRQQQQQKLQQLKHKKQLLSSSKAVLVQRRPPRPPLPPPPLLLRRNSNLKMIITKDEEEDDDNHHMNKVRDKTGEVSKTLAGNGVSKIFPSTPLRSQQTGENHLSRCEAQHSRASQQNDHICDQKEKDQNKGNTALITTNASEEPTKRTTTGKEVVSEDRNGDEDSKDNDVIGLPQQRLTTAGARSAAKTKNASAKDMVVKKLEPPMLVVGRSMTTTTTTTKNMMLMAGRQRAAVTATPMPPTKMTTQTQPPPFFLTKRCDYRAPDRDIQPDIMQRQRGEGGGLHNITITTTVTTPAVTDRHHHHVVVKSLWSSPSSSPISPIDRNHNKNHRRIQTPMKDDLYMMACMCIQEQQKHKNEDVERPPHLLGRGSSFSSLSDCSNSISRWA